MLTAAAVAATAVNATVVATALALRSKIAAVSMVRWRICGKMADGAIGDAPDPTTAPVRSTTGHLDTDESS